MINLIKEAIKLRPLDEYDKRRKKNSDPKMNIIKEDKNSDPKMNMIKKMNMVSEDKNSDLKMNIEYGKRR